MAQRRCAGCGCLFVPRRNVPQQRYCSKRACQRTRRRRWRERHPAYWRGYRQRRPDYAERNREQQRERNRRRGSAGTGPSPPIAKMDAYVVEMRVLSEG